jgi:hypothetical protein
LSAGKEFTTAPTRSADIITAKGEKWDGRYLTSKRKSLSH